MHLVVLVLKQLQSLIPAINYGCEGKASSQVKPYSTRNCIMIYDTFISVLRMTRNTYLKSISNLVLKPYSAKAQWSHIVFFATLFSVLRFWNLRSSCSILKQNVPPSQRSKTSQRIYFSFQPVVVGYNVDSLFLWTGPPLMFFPRRSVFLSNPPWWYKYEKSPHQVKKVVISVNQNVFNRFHTLIPVSI